MVHYWPLALTSVAEGYISVKRIENLLLKLNSRDNISKDSLTRMEIDSSIIRNGSSSRINSSSHSHSKGITMIDVKVNWNDSNIGLFSIDLSFDEGRLYPVIGPVGSGKSTLFQTILGELIPSEGNILINGTISYASQEPWLFQDTIRNNIIFVDNFNKKRFGLIN